MRGGGGISNPISHQWRGPVVPPACGRYLGKQTPAERCSVPARPLFPHVQQAPESPIAACAWAVNVCQRGGRTTRSPVVLCCSRACGRWTPCQPHRSWARKGRQGRITRSECLANVLLTAVFKLLVSGLLSNEVRGRRRGREGGGRRSKCRAISSHRTTFAFPFLSRASQAHSGISASVAGF